MRSDINAAAAASNPKQINLFSNTGGVGIGAFCFFAGGGGRPRFCIILHIYKRSNDGKSLLIHAKNTKNCRTENNTV